MSEIMDRELGWDDEIERDGTGFAILPAGDYPFEVIDFEKGRHNGSEKLPACNKAVVHIKVEGPEGVAVIKHNLFLHTITEGMLCAFFAAIGQRKKGEKLKMNWNLVIGATGKLKLGIRNYKNKDGEDRQSNEIKKFYEYDGGAVPEGFSPAGTFKPGEF